jgi:hypothetical protein
MHYYNTNYDNKIIRANYIRNQMSKDDFINALVTREREINKNRDIRNVYDMIRVAGTDIIQKYISENNSKELISQFIKLIDYTNNEFLKLSKIYTLTMPYITLDKNKYSQNTYMHISSTGKSSPVNYEEKFLDTLSVTQTT